MHANEISKEVVEAAFAVHSELGPGLLESAYQACLAHELGFRGLFVEVNVPLKIHYKQVNLEVGNRLDLVVENTVLLELKAVAKVHPIHEAQLLSYLKLSKLSIGLLLNFHERRMKDGICRMVYNFDESHNAVPLRPLRPPR